MLISNRLLINILVILAFHAHVVAHTKTEKILRKDFFQEIMGFNETILLDAWKQRDKNNYNALLNNYLVAHKQNDGTTVFTLKSGNRCIKAGYFQELSLGDLSNQEKAVLKPGNGTFNVVAGHNTTMTSWFRKHVDIGALQAEPVNKDAVFQVASNFSALEPVSPADLLEGGITNYIYDWTQGPFAAISAAPGLIVRMYCPFFDPKKQPADWRQTAARQVNLLDKVTTWFPITNGYVDFTVNKQALNRCVSEQDKKAIKIGFHGDIQVTSGFLLDQQYVARVTDPEQCINQVFTAAIDFGSLNSNLKNNKQAKEKAQLLLDAAYEGTIKSAAIKNKKKVFLTLIGGGVFKNDLDWIAQAIEKNKKFIQDSGLDVTLIIYTMARFDDFHKRMLALTKETGGAFKVYEENRE